MVRKRKKCVLLATAALCLIGIMGGALTASAWEAKRTWWNGDHWLQDYRINAVGYEWWDLAMRNSYDMVDKCHSNRDFVAQVTKTNLTTYSSVFVGTPYGFFDPNGFEYTNKAWVRGVGANNASYHRQPDWEGVTMGFRTDDRAVGMYQLEGVWSPDTY